MTTTNEGLFEYTGRWFDLEQEFSEPDLELLNQRDLQLQFFLDKVISPWQTYTPTGSGYTVGNGTLQGAFKLMGPHMWWRVMFTLGSSSAMSTDPKFATPTGFLLDNSNGFWWPGWAIAFDASASTPNDHWSGQCVAKDSGESTLTTRFIFTTAAGVNTTVTSLLPFQWATGDVLSAGGVVALKNNTYS